MHDETAKLPLGPGLSERPVEDRGHETAKWYAYQYACTARECFAMLTKPRPWVLCEWHTDYVCPGPDGAQPHVLVSVKHRSQDQGAWGLADLPYKGGFKVLFERWIASEKSNTCLWVTNNGFKIGANQARELAKNLSAKPELRDTEALKWYAKNLQPAIGSSSLDETVDFLSALTMYSTGGDEHSMRALVIEDTVRPALARLGVRPGFARAAYDAAFNLVDEAVRGLNPHEPDVDWMVGDDLADHSKGVRMITRARFLRRLQDSGIPITSDAIDEQSASSTAMSRKLRAGMLGPTVVSAAPRLRQRWYEIEVSFRPDVPSPFADEVGRIRAEILHHALVAETRTRRTEAPYGPQMHMELSQLISAAHSSPKIPVGMPELMGCVYQLTDECKIWWSDEFDPQHEAPWIAGSRSGSQHMQLEFPVFHGGANA
ncbi:hypothetical protein [Micromonospora lupini]|uniref:hypothetical protein n=1 Tax=Micromonospora lupini TaxID=285679 RepID=UPI001181BBAD|nr:hypothetical protein [Micromonospora lupini]